MTALLLVVGAVTAPPSLARAGCNNGPQAGQADIGLVQSVSALTDGNLLDHLTITNFGPCNVPNVGLTVTLPGAFVAASSNPSSWTCTANGSTVTCFETSTIGVPGTADVYLEYAPGLGLITACAATFSGATPGPCDPTTGPVPDPNPANNTSTAAAALLGAGETLVYGPGGNPIPSSAFTHTTSVTLASGGLVNVYQAALCPTSINDCFLGTITVNFTSVNGAKTWTLTFLASLAGKKSLSQITIWNSVGGAAFTALSNCSGKNATDPCVQSRSRSTNAEGATVYTIVVAGTVDNGMTAD